MIYLDNAATTKIDPEVLDAMMPYLTEEYGNPGGLYTLGRNAKDAVEIARERVAAFINAEPTSVVFTSGGSEANNLAVKSFIGFEKHRTTILTDKTEHDSVLKALCDAKEIEFVPVNHSGSVDISAFCDKITEKTGFASIMYANNETGSVNPIVQIGEECKDKGIIFHTDCVQAAGNYDLNVSDFGCDFMSISSHKIHGPKGVGALYVRNQIFCRPLISGGSTQEFGLRGGTENVAGIVGFGKACEIAKVNLKENASHIMEIKSMFYNSLMSCMGEYKLLKIVHLNGNGINTGKAINIRFDGIDAHTLILMLDLYGVCVSGGSACTSHDNLPSHVLLAMGISPDDARNSIRISFSRMNTAKEVTDAARIIAECVRNLNKYY